MEAPTPLKDLHWTPLEGPGRHYKPLLDPAADQLVGPEQVERGEPERSTPSLPQPLRHPGPVRRQTRRRTRGFGAGLGAVRRGDARPSRSITAPRLGICWPRPRK